MSDPKTIVALIPARAGSIRIPRKNIRPLQKVPLIAYTVSCARQAAIFTDVLVCTDDDETAAIAQRYGATIVKRPESPSDEPDYTWVRRVMESRTEEAFAILRPTSPFRKPESVQRAWEQFKTSGCDSLRAVEPVRQHPGKMWIVQEVSKPAQATGILAGEEVRLSMQPLLPWALSLPVGSWNSADRLTVPWHSCPTQSLPPVYVQNASLEMAWRWVAFAPGYWAGDSDYCKGTISGTRVLPFILPGHQRPYEGFDLNTEEDWVVAEWLLDTLDARLPYVPDGERA